LVPSGPVPEEEGYYRAPLRGTPLGIFTLDGRQIHGFSLRENALVRGANGHVQRNPSLRILNGVPLRGEVSHDISTASSSTPTGGSGPTSGTATS
jgi:hypothetical protein